MMAPVLVLTQGEMTSSEDVDVIRYGLREETDMRVCLLNYRKNGTAFLNQFNLSPLRDVNGKLVSREETCSRRRVSPRCCRSCGPSMATL